MWPRYRLVGVSTVAIAFTISSAMRGQSVPTAADHVTAVRTLLPQLQWNDDKTHAGYDMTKDATTGRLLKEIDAFIIDSFQPATVTEGQVSAALARLLNPTAAVAGTTPVFLVTLSNGGRFLIVDLDLPRGGRAIREDAVSFRAYRDDGTHFTFVAEAHDLHSSDANSPFLNHLSAMFVSQPPVSGEAWFFAVAEVPPHAPPLVAIRLYAFDGRTFRTVWASNDVMAEGSNSVIELNGTGFVLNTLIDPTGQAAGSPTVVRHEQYSLTATGPAKVTDWQTDRQ
jgi:hypothetical protein